MQLPPGIPPRSKCAQAVLGISGLLGSRAGYFCSRPDQAGEVVKLLRDGEPRVEVRLFAGDKPALEIAVWMLQPGEHRLVARRLRDVLSRAGRLAPSEARHPLIGDDH